MQVLIVHGDAEIGEPLMRMVKDYTTHACHFVRNGTEAITCAVRNSRCDFLLTQLENDAVDGLALGGNLSELFPQLQTAFLPGYAASEQRLDVRDTKVFPEPIDGQGVLDAIARAADPAWRGRDLFHVVDILQMCCLSRKSGALQMVHETKTGVVHLREGAIVHAETETLQGKAALFQIVVWELVEIAYDGSITSAARTISGPWHEMLTEAVLRRKQQKTAARC